MIDRANQDAVYERYAELTGMASQLTTPSRHHSDLVDIWFGVQWAEHDAEWDESFARLSNGRRPDPDTPSYFGLFAHTANNGLIVARQVSADRAVWRKVEVEASALIEIVNLDVATRRAPPPTPPSRPSGWSLRMREATSFLMSVLWLGEQKPRLESVTKLPIQVHGSSSAGR
ncbi:MAG: hypothetical protein ABI601_16105 [bacterium]